MVKAESPAMNEGREECGVRTSLKFKKLITFPDRPTDRQNARPVREQGRRIDCDGWSIL